MSSICASKVHFIAAIAKAPPVLIFLLSLIGLSTKVSAQVISADNGAFTNVEVVGNLINIGGGQVSGDHTNLFHTFEQFDLTSEQTANFVATPEVQNVIGRVNGGGASTIDGVLQVSESGANLYLMNPAGILLGHNARLNLSGGFTATTATGIEFNEGQLKANGEVNYGSLNGEPNTFHFDNKQAGVVANFGDLSVSSGEAISLIGGTVVNAGSLSAPSGTVTMAAVEGENLIRITQGNQLLSLEVKASDSKSATANAITPLSIGEMLTGSGLPSATALITNPDGTLRLGLASGYETEYESAIAQTDNLGDNPGESLEGGVAIATGSISTVGFTTGAKGGNINVLGTQVSLQNATLNASGNAGGGLIRVGGDYQGQGSVISASHTLIDEVSSLSANALEHGNGGTIIVWADAATAFYGNLEAKGGILGGNGGFAEVSGKQKLAMAGGIDLSAPQGSVGNVFLDPENIVITDGAAPPDTATTTYLSSSYVENLSNTANVELAATNDFTVENLSDNELLFQPGRSVTFTADSDLDGNGAFLMLDTADSIDADRGRISIFGAGIRTGQLVTDTVSSNREDAGDVVVISSRGVVVSGISTNNSSSGNNAGNGGNVRIVADSGNVVIDGPVETESYAGGNNAGSGGNVSVRASGSITVENIFAYSRAANNNANNGGDVSLIANGDINTQAIQTQSEVGRNNSHNGGDVTIRSANGSIGTKRIITSGGRVLLSASDDIEIESIDASNVTNNAEATSVDISTQGLFTAIGTTGASISTVGTDDGSITIAYNSPDNPFVVGDSSINGTVGILESSTARLENGSFSGNHSEGNIRLINRSNDPGTNPPEPPVNPEVDSTEPSVELGAELPASAEAKKGKLPLSHTGNETDTATLLAPTELEELFQTFREVEAGISEEFNNYLGIPENQQSTSITVATVQKTLSDIEHTTGANPAIVYIYFVPNAASKETVENENPKNDLQGHFTHSVAKSPKDELEVMVITANGVPIRRRGWGITREQVEETSRTLRQQVTSQFSSAQQYLPPAQQLYDWIMAPIEHTLKQKNVSSLGFVMDTGLRTLPVAVLHDGDRYLVEDYSLGLLPSFSLTDFAQAKQSSHPVNFETARVLAIGASRFEYQPDLPAVEAEVKIAAEHLWKGNVFLNEDFVLQNVQAQLKNEAFSVLHLATHAVFKSGDLDQSYVQLWDDELSLGELSSLKLDESNISLIVLSACNTALGDPASEYGFAGFAVNAGTQSAVASLWPVNDEGTLGFMSQFYDQLRGASTRVEALRQAQIRLINGEIGIVNGSVYGPNDELIAILPQLAESGQWDFSHPFYWSAFTMIGNPW